MKQRRFWYLMYPLTVLAVLTGIFWGSRMVSVFSQAAPIPRQQRILIDAGHGGVDGGATSCAGIPESRYNLEIALRLEDLFHLLGYDTAMIRREDISVYTKGETIAQKKISDLKERVRVANERDNTILLSIHQNHFPDPRYSGSQVFYGDSENSQLLAKLMQEGFRILDPDNHREIRKSSGIYLMEHIQCTGVLIECGFLSNPTEEAKLRSPEYQQKLCSVIVTAVDRFQSNT